MKQIAVLILLIVCNRLPAQLKLPALVQDSMVLQRNVKLKIWGWARAGETVHLAFNHKRYTTITAKDKTWAISLPPADAGGPYNMRIVAGDTMELKNILIGDVWLCSGQSNMVHQMSLHSITYADEIKQANFPEIRQFEVPNRSDLQRPSNMLSGGSWKSVNSQNLLQFSAVAYFFAKNIYEKYHIPIGLINASVGGSPIEAWMSEKGLAGFPELTAALCQNKDTNYLNGLNTRLLAWNATRPKSVDAGLTSKPAWYEPSLSPQGWQTINIPGYWEDQGVRDLDGVVWYRREIDIPASMVNKVATIFLGRIVDADALYVNGALAGTTGYQYPQRRYTVPPGTLKAGKNLFVIRVTNQSGKGGFVPGKPYYIEAANQVVDLKGYWQYKVGAVYESATGAPPSFSPQNQPAALYNAMIAPLLNYSVRGVVWYQGESNTAHPETYGKLLHALISDWRSLWHSPQMPFIYVQLPNFMETDYLPAGSNWALLREAQLKTLVVPNTAMAVAIDLGEWNDIHPDNKKDVGQRLALAARKIAYGERDLVSSGPLFKNATVNGSQVIIEFSNTGTGLVSNDGEPLHQFAVAGADRKFVWATAVIRNDSVVVWNDGVQAPVYVRYAWADNPQGANLYNKEKLPASPFRTDTDE